MPEIVEQLGRIDIPLIGNSIAVGIFSLLHIAFASLAVGFMIMAPIFEWLGRSHSFHTDLAYAVTRFTLVTFTVSVVLAVIMSELFVGLFPLTNSWIFNQFRYPIYIAIAAFFLQLFALYPYYHYWNAIRKRSLGGHILLGAVAAFFVLVWVAILDGMGSYMLTPVDIEKGMWANVLNPTWIPLVLHRFFGNFVVAGYAIAAYAGWQLGRTAEADEPYYLYLLKVGFLIGLAALFVQPFTGYFYATQIKSAVPQAYEQLVQGRFQWLVYIQFTLIAFLFLGSHFLMRMTRRRGGGFLIGELLLVGSALLMIVFVGSPNVRRLFTFALMGGSLYYLLRWRGSMVTGGGELNRPVIRRLALTLGIASLLTYWTMGTIRETARRPDTIRGMISLKDEARLDIIGRGGGDQEPVDDLNVGPRLPAPIPQD